MFLLLATIFIVTQAVFGGQMWVMNSDYSGGMDEYYADYASVWHQTLAHVAMVALQLSSDGFLASIFVSFACVGSEDTVDLSILFRLGNELANEMGIGPSLCAMDNMCR